MAEWEEMKQMSLIEMDGFLKGKCIPSDLKVNETNAEYLVRKFGELESKLETALRECRSAGITIDNLEDKCSALAAENAGLKAGILQASEDMEAHHDDYALFSYDADGEQMDALLRLCDAQDSIASLEDVKTPATDAFLAEVLAQGVEMFEQWCRGERDFTLIDEDVADAAAYEECVKRAEYFAAQLRKGGNQ
ncbi:hypothetical protein FNH60_19680 [Salmonella enterica subsp. enterica]|nr:hypothetical protein [Salmonella enterica subsp. enterica serovar Corvallis]EBQ9985935.1 hypothetical protein [Salmonella enterica subsp. enterica serovar Schwarzengrund]EJA3951977.1 hypothetical protein [Salmonella enterica]EBS6221723.1 hypothetical protein [Salmonella enterica subsp. enterica serovar Schwarzengrund]EBV0359700.1 hypothetical protein [Salmonella enterica subsp. enterica serovar Schwarzengrund]